MEIDDLNIPEPESLQFRIVTLNSGYTPDEAEKKRYESADIVNNLIDYETSIVSCSTRILDGIKTSEDSGYCSDELSLLKECTSDYLKKIKDIQSKVNKTRRELAEKSLGSHGLKLDEECFFNIDGYQFKATPLSRDMNCIISCQFSAGSIPNINMSLSDVTVTGEKKLRRSQLPALLIMNLWFND